ncbi:MAG TPA: molybdopterin cofactor-binding domain-containing protein [Spirochaetia bacterium]|nr:molybdopterin cofactor-binding domain-containing protein [Spirochaetia bacterium]
MGSHRVVGHSLMKIDSLALARGTDAFTADYPIADPLVLKFLYSPVAHAEIRSIDTTQAEALPGVIGVFHYWNSPRTLFTTAGQGYPEPSPYDFRLFDHRVRFVGDRICLVAAESGRIADEALALIAIEFDPLPPLFDPEFATDPESPRLHDEDEHAVIPAMYEPEHNVAAGIDITVGDPAAAMDAADLVVERRYTTHQTAHAAIEPHVVACSLDSRGRFTIVSATQVPFHARRIVGRVLEIPIHRIRVIKPRIGGGFGGKQEVLLEPYAALVSVRTGRNTICEMTRPETFVSTRTRHPMRIGLRTGVTHDGRITALEMDALMDTGAYGSHALTVLSNTGAKVLPLFNKIPNIAFTGRSVYTTHPVGGAYRGYGATQGYFALNQQIDIITRRLGVDMAEYCRRHHIREGETSPIFRALGEGKEGVDQIIESCSLSECIDRGSEAIGWAEKRGARRTSDRRVHGLGMAVCMQGSGIPLVDMGAASMKLNENGSFNLAVGATDLGTGSDTVLIQIAAETLQIPPGRVEILSSDTDLTPFDVGAYASSTTYISGKAVEKCAASMVGELRRVAAAMLETTAELLVHTTSGFRHQESGAKVSYEEIAYRSLYGSDQMQLQTHASHSAPGSPPPFIAQFAEVAVDPETGAVEVVHFVSAVDCGVAINPALAEGQIEGAVLNGISYALTEEFLYSDVGRLTNATFGRYGLFTSADAPRMTTILVPSVEPTGPFGAKSVGEIGINGVAPAIANAVYDAVGARLYDLPMTPQRIYEAIGRDDEP